jgi:multiple antibiotic resistance protein
LSPQEIVLFSTTLLAVVNPVAASVVFVRVAGEFDPRIQRKRANRTSYAILIILCVCAWLGNSILGLMGLTPPMLQAAGGFILLNYGLRMVTVEDSKLTTGEKESARDAPEDRWKGLAVVPLAIPGTVGAGSITTVILQASTFNTPRDWFVISVVSLGIAIVMWIILRLAGPIARRLGPTGMNIITRVMGILVTAMAFGLLARGVEGLLPGLAR